VFEALDREPRRFDAATMNLGPVQADASAVWLIDNTNANIAMFDLSAKLIWRQTGLLRFQAPAVLWQLSGALGASKQLRVLVSANDSGHVSGHELWTMSASGSIEARRALPLFARDPQYMLDALERDVIVATGESGDITLLHMTSDGIVEGNQLVREEYLELRPERLALDSEGAAYMASAAGGREAKQQRELLCQLPVHGSARCFTLGELSASTASRTLMDEFVVTEPGVVYVRSGADLRRYELPAAAQ
jgi:hypothetical protein